MWEKAETILSREGSLEGVLTGSTHMCRLEGCSGIRISVKWPDGKHTYPCSKGIKWNDKLNAWQIM